MVEELKVCLLSSAVTLAIITMIRLVVFYNRLYRPTNKWEIIMQKASIGGIGFFIGLLQLAFIVLKLMNIIMWSWVWVLAPIWISGILLVILMLIILLLQILQHKL